MKDVNPITQGSNGGQGQEEDFFLFYDTPDTEVRKDTPKEMKCRDARNLLAIDNEKYAEALRYGFRILPEVRDFVKFSVALADYAGKDIIPLCSYIFEEVTASIPSKIAKKLVDGRYDQENIPDDEVIADALEDLCSCTEVKENLDDMQHTGAGYGSVDEFKRILNFVGCHNYLSAYNALLLYLQKPDCTFAFNTSVWKNGYDRRPRHDARTLLVQNDAGQMQCVFDYADTETIPKTIYSLFDFDYELEEKWNKITEDVRTLSVDDKMRNLQTNLPTYGIFLDWTLKANDSFVGFTEEFTGKELTVRTGDKSFKTYSKYRISVNYRYPEEDAFYFLCHELSRMFCTGDILCHDGKCRSLTIKEREFETETTVWLVFRRLGLFNPMENYLDLFCADGRVPNCSIEHVMKAVCELERMLAGVVPPEQSPLYSSDILFRTAADDLKGI